jgi:hypothetical protein
MCVSTSERVPCCILACNHLQPHNACYNTACANKATSSLQHIPMLPTHHTLVPGRCLPALQDGNCASQVIDQLGIPFSSETGKY